MRHIADSAITDPLAAALVALDVRAARAALGDLSPGALPGDRILAAHEHLRCQHRLGVIDGVTLAAATALSRRLLARRVLSAVSDRPDAPPAHSVVVASPPGDEHLLEAETAAAALRHAGWAVDLLPGAAAAAELGDFLIRRDASALALVCATPPGLPGVATALATARQAGVPAVVTGAAFGGDALRALRLGADAWAPDLRTLLGVAERWREEPPEPGEGAELADEYLTLRDRRLSLLAAAAARCAPATEAQERTLAAAIDHLAAAVLVDDSRLLLDHLSAELTRARRAGPTEEGLLGLFEALAGALPASLRRARAFADEGCRHLRLALGRPGRLLAPATPAAEDGSEVSDGQVFADLLLLGAMACRAPLALLSVPRAGGGWSTLSFGADARDHLGDPILLDYLCEQGSGTEITDLGLHPGLTRSALAGEPLGVRWVYGTAVRGRKGGVLGVFAVLDRWTRQVTRREQRAVEAVVRQLGGHLEQWQRLSGESPAPLAVNGANRPASRRSSDGQPLLRSHEVAALFDVTERTVINWAAAGKLPALRTVGGHLRFRHEDVAALLAGRRPGGTVRSG